MKNLLSLKFWFNLRPGLLLPIYQKFLLALVIILVILSLALNFLMKRNKTGLYAQFWRGSYYFCFTNAFVFLLLLFFNYELVPFLSARFWYLLVGVEMAVWAFFILRTLYFIPKKKEQYEKEKEFKKYIP